MMENPKLMDLAIMAIMVIMVMSQHFHRKFAMMGCMNFSIIIIKNLTPLDKC